MSTPLDTAAQRMDSPAQAGAVIRTEDLSRVFMLGTTQVNALQGVTLQIETGEFVALMGPSGCGKSTLMHLLGCLDVPSTGRYYLEGRDVSTLSAQDRSLLRGRRLGFVFQNFFLIPSLNALDNVALPLLYQPGTHGRDARQQALTALEQVGLADRAAHRPMELSGGERQRAAIARALVNRPAVLLADEPTGNLDSATGAELMAMLIRLWHAGLTILLVTHDPNVASYARRIIHMKDGRIVRQETPLQGHPEAQQEAHHELRQ
jgi:putative ABC transport system ATP-binding protein